jgi:hypothetical protein
MSGKTVLGGLVLAFGLSLLTACGNVGSAAPAPQTMSNVHTNQVLPTCNNVPQIPACGK